MTPRAQPPIKVTAVQLCTASNCDQVEVGDGN
jgi:hypothetical protein